MVEITITNTDASEQLLGIFHKQYENDQQSCSSNRECKIFKTTIISPILLTGSAICIHLTEKELAFYIKENRTVGIVLCAIALVASIALLIAVLYKTFSVFRYISSEKKISQESNSNNLDIKLSSSGIIYIWVHETKDYEDSDVDDEAPGIGLPCKCYYEINLLEYIRYERSQNKQYTGSGIKRFDKSESYGSISWIQDDDFTMQKAEQEPSDGKESPKGVGYYIRQKISKYVQKTQATL